MTMTLTRTRTCNGGVTRECSKTATRRVIVRQVVPATRLAPEQTITLALEMCSGHASSLRVGRTGPIGEVLAIETV